MADERNPNESIEDDDATGMSDEELVGMDDDEEFEDEDEGIEEGE